MGTIVTLICVFLLAAARMLMRFRLLVQLENNDLTVKLRVLFLSFTLFGGKRERIRKKDFTVAKFRRRRDKVLGRYKIKSRPDKKPDGIPKKKKPSVFSSIGRFKGLISELVRLARNDIRFDAFDVTVAVGGKDAAKIALNYGYTVQAVQYLVTFLECTTSLIKCKNKSASVDADFSEGKWQAKASVALSVRTFRAIRMAFTAYREFVKIKKQKPNKAKK